jgi:tetratricopeptide (TPR) repeat protein/DNA-binding CsgD family transcriptional regulator
MLVSRIWLMLMLLTIATGAIGQKNIIDSLRNVVAKDSTNTTALLRLSKLTRSISLPEAETYSLKALNVSTQRKSNNGIDSALYELASIAYIGGNLVKAAEFLQQRIILELTSRDSLNLARSYNFFAGIQNELGKRVEALDSYLKAKNIADKLGDLKLNYSVHYNLGLFYHDDRDKALVYRLQAYEISKRIPPDGQSNRRVLEMSAVLANEYTLAKDNKTARKFLNEALLIVPKVNDASLESYTYAVYAEILRSEKKYDSAIYCQRKSIALKELTGDKSRLHDTYGTLGELYLERGKYQEAIQELSRAIELAKESNSLFFEYRWLPKLAAAYSASKNYEMAYKTMARFHELSDSVLNKEKVKSIAEMEAKYESEKKQREIETLKVEQELQSRINFSQQIIFGVVVVALVLAGLAYYFRAKAKSVENKRLSEKVDAQNRELSTISLLVNKKNEALQSIKAKLSDAATQMNFPGDAVKGVIKEIDGEIAFDAEWNTFKFHFEQVHPGFFANLANAVPALTNKEQRFCAYLKSNLSTKEIAQLTNTTVRGVQQSKYRINQKFDAAQLSLSDFLQKH